MTFCTHKSVIKFLTLNFVLILILSRAVFCAETLTLGEIAGSDTSSWDKYLDPYLIVQSEHKFNYPLNVVLEALRTRLKAGELPVQTRFSQEKSKLKSLTIDQYLLPKELSDPDQLKAIKDCNKDKCQMKLKRVPEVVQLSKSNNKKETYRELLYNRIVGYLTKRELLGYEDRKSNQSSVIKMIDLIAELKKKPQTYKYLKTNLWNEASDPARPSNSWIKQEVVVMAPDQMQPILRIAEDMEFKEGNNHLILELPIYTNHYFDSSMTLFELDSDLKNNKETKMIITDVMEIDELKKSAIIRSLFTGKMVKAVVMSQESFFSGIEKEISTKK